MFPFHSHQNIFLDFFLLRNQGKYSVFPTDRSVTMISFFDEQLELRILRITEAQFRHGRHKTTVSEKKTSRVGARQSPPRGVKKIN